MPPLFKRPGLFGPGGGGAAPWRNMVTKLFDTVTLYDDPADTAITPTAASDVHIDMAAISGDVTVTFPGSGTIGQAIGVTVTTDPTGDPVDTLSYAGPVDPLVTAPQYAGECDLFTWDGTSWRLVATYRLTPWLTVIETANPTNGVLALDSTSSTVTLPDTPPPGTRVGVKSTNGGTTVAASGSDQIDLADGSGTTDTSLSLPEAGDAVVLSYSGGPGGIWWQAAAVRVDTTFDWTFATGQARTAQALTAADVGKIAWQTDMQLAYRVVPDTSGNPRWGRVDDPRMTVRRALFSINNLNTFNVAGLQIATPTTPLGSGVSARNASAGTTFATRMTRGGLVTTVGAGNRANCRFGTNDSNNNPLVPSAGFRSRVACVQTSTTAAGIWTVMGFGDALFSPASGTNPNTQTNCIAMGRFGQANVQIYCNDGAGACTEVDCGADFPAIDAGEGYELEVFTLSGAEWVAQVTRLNTGHAFSTTFSSNVPAAAQGGMGWYCDNRTDAAGTNACDVAYWIGDYFGTGP